MTTEDDFQRQLDEYPEDWQTRLVFADWLQERDDPRAEGYRALGELRRNPSHSKLTKENCPAWHTPEKDDFRDYSPYALPRDWFDLLGIEGSDEHNAPLWLRRNNATRREVEDAAAFAFARLPAERRAELLAQPATA